MLLALIALASAADPVILVTYQNSVTNGNNLLNSPIYLSSFDASGNILATGANNYLTFFTRTAGFFGNPYNVTLTNTLKDVKIRPDSGATWVATIDDSTNNLFLLNKPSGTYLSNQTVDCGSRPLTISWANGGSRLLVGLSNANVQVYAYNSSTSQWYLNQTLTTAHSGGVAKLSGSLSRFVTCGVSDSNVQVWYFNTTTGYYTTTANQTIPSGVVAPCTAIDLAANEQRFAVGQNNGTFAIYERDANFFYSSVATNTTAHGSTPINAVKFTNNAVYLVTSGSSPNNQTNLWTKANSFSTPNTYSINGQSIDWDNVNSQFAIGTYGNVTGINTIQALSANASACPSGTVESLNSSACSCTSPQVWVYGACGTAVTCNTGYIWDSTLQLCKVNCATSPYNTNSNSTNYEYNSCYCNTGYNWDHINMVCSSYITCTGAANSPGTNANSISCNCNSGYIWNSTSNLCVRNCASVNLSTGLNTTNVTLCNCPTNYYFASWTGIDQGVCQVNCGQYQRAYGSTSDYLTCACINGYTWSSSIPGCTLQCSTMSYSKGTNKNTTACNCQSDYRWDYIIGQCISSKASHAAAIACGIAIPLGVLGLIALGLLLWWCLTPAAVVYAPPMIMPPPPVYSAIRPISQVPVPAQPVVVQPARQVVGAPVSGIGLPQNLVTIPAKPPIPVGMSSLGVGIPRY